MRPRRVVKGTKKKAKNQYLVTLGIPAIQFEMSFCASILRKLLKQQKVFEAFLFSVGGRGLLRAQRNALCMLDAFFFSSEKMGESLKEFRETLQKNDIFADYLNAFLNLPVG